jgi:hypothetical protein
MSTFNTTRRLLVVPVFAALAVCAQASQAADRTADTQARVAAVVAGVHQSNSTPAQSVGTVSHRIDSQDSARRLLAGERNLSSNAGEGSTQASIGTNGQSSNEAQKLTQGVVLGRVAS